MVHKVRGIYTEYELHHKINEGCKFFVLCSCNANIPYAMFYKELGSFNLAVTKTLYCHWPIGIIVVPDFYLHNVIFSF